MSRNQSSNNPELNDAPCPLCGLKHHRFSRIGKLHRTLANPEARNLVILLAFLANATLFSLSVWHLDLNHEVHTQLSQTLYVAGTGIGFGGSLHILNGWLNSQEQEGPKDL